MTKKKPDFLRDLDTAIMDELTGGGIKGNAAGLVGTLTQIKEIKQLCGLPFCGYMAKLETVRPSGAPDEVTVVFAEDVPYKACAKTATTRNTTNRRGISGIGSTKTAAYSPHIRKIIKGGEYRGGYPKITLRACARVV